jgi:hypothetical protein
MYVLQFVTTHWFYWLRDSIMSYFCYVGFCQVRLAAFQALGGFISTFADAKFTGLELTQEGHVIYKTSYQQCVYDYYLLIFSFPTSLMK